MEEQTLEKIKDLLAKNERIAIVVGKNPTLDTMGAALSLYLSFSEAQQKVSIASPNDPLVEVSSLVGIQKVVKTLDGDGGDLIVSFPYKTNEQGESEIQKVSYTLEDGFLNIVVKAGADGLSFTDKNVKYRRSGGVPQILFVVGTQRLSDLGNLFDPQALKDTTVVNIDNSSQNQQFGDIVLVSQGFSSVSEQVAELLVSLNYKITTDIAQNLLTGISFATDNFQKPSTSAVAFEMSALLLKQGAVRNRINQPRPSAGPNASFLPPVQSNQRPAQQQRKQFDQPRQDFAPRVKQQQQFRNAPRFNPQFTQPQQSPQPFAQVAPAQDNQPQPQKAQFDNPFEVAPQVPDQPTQIQEAPVAQKDNAAPDAPPDWLTPKVYKGSTLV